MRISEVDSKIIVLIGPTSSGKTTLALKLAERLNGELVSFDSRQLYKYMDIGTGKLPAGDDYAVEKNDGYWKVNNILVWGYDLATPDKTFSAYDYVKFAVPTINQIIITGKTPILVGGTGFYLDILSGNKKMSSVPPNIVLRNNLQTLSLEQLQKMLIKLSQTAYENVDLNNPARVIRAIEIAQSKKVKKNSKESAATTSQTKRTENALKYNVIGLTATREVLYNRADSWVDFVWNNGLIEETQGLLNSRYKNTKKLQGIVYKTTVEYINGGLSEQDATKRIKYDLHAYIRRQQTYFKKIVGINWIDMTGDNKQDKKLEKVYNILDG